MDTNIYTPCEQIMSDKIERLEKDKSELLAALECVLKKYKDSVEMSYGYDATEFQEVIESQRVINKAKGIK
ncbi:MAG: hypothetical protein ACUZ8H_09350 [Candidatus Anammoxibacter sp.]